MTIFKILVFVLWHISKLNDLEEILNILANSISNLITITEERMKPWGFQQRSIIIEREPVM